MRRLVVYPDRIRGAGQRNLARRLAWNGSSDRNRVIRYRRQRQSQEPCRSRWLPGRTRQYHSGWRLKFKTQHWEVFSSVASLGRKVRGLNPSLNLKCGGYKFLPPLFAPLQTVFDSPIDLRQFKSDVVPPFLGLIPLVLQNLVVLSLEFAVEQISFQQPIHFT